MKLFPIHRMKSHRTRAANRTVTRPGPNTGFTLVELMVTITVAAIISSIAIPSFRTFLQNDRQWTQASSLVISLNAARSEAVKQDVAGGISVCPTTNGVTCGGTAWAQGWIVVSNAPNSTPIQTVAGLPPGTTLTEANGLAAVTYLSNGMTSASAAFTMCDARGAAHARYTQVSAAGRVASSMGKKLDGTALRCP